MSGLVIGLTCGLSVPAIAILIVFVYYYVYRRQSKNGIHDIEAPPQNCLSENSETNISFPVTNETSHQENQLVPENDYNFRSNTPTQNISSIQWNRSDLTNQSHNPSGNQNAPTSSKRFVQRNEENTPPVLLTQRHNPQNALGLENSTDGEWTQKNIFVNSKNGCENKENIKVEERRPVLIEVTIEDVKRRRQINRERRENNLNFVRQRELDCVLIIAADATPHNVGGYCVNLQENSCETYSLASTQIPWKLSNPRDTSEFEMKNLMFAIMLWQEEILKYRKFRIYTDNSAVTSTNNKFGRVANKLLNHCIRCNNRNVRRINKTVYCNRGREENEFRLFIQPADDLSRGKQDSCEQFITDYYGIPPQNFKRSFMENNRNQMSTEFVEKANYVVAQWKIPCGKCGYSYRLGALRFIQASNWRNNKRQPRNRRRQQNWR